MAKGRLVASRPAQDTGQDRSEVRQIGEREDHVERAGVGREAEGLDRDEGGSC